ncbi:MAG: hypothetical protein ACREOF_16390 [Gemmatimonadales bacterium]
MYVDPQAGSILFQVMVAGLLGAAFTVKRWWFQVTGALGALVARFARR